MARGSIIIIPTALACLVSPGLCCGGLAWCLSGLWLRFTPRCDVRLRLLGDVSSLFLRQQATIKAKLFIFLLFPNDCNLKNVNRRRGLLLENRCSRKGAKNSVFSFQGARCQIKWSRTCHGLAEGQAEIAHWARYQSEQAVRHDAIWKRNLSNQSVCSVAKHNAAR